MILIFQKVPDWIKGQLCERNKSRGAEFECCLKCITAREE